MSYRKVAVSALTAVLISGCAQFNGRESAKSDAKLLGSDLARAARSYDSLGKQHRKAALLAARREYNEATSDFVYRLQRLKPAKAWSGPLPWPAADGNPAFSVQLETADAARTRWAPLHFNEFLPTPLTLSPGHPHDPVRPDGIGAPILAHRFERPGKPDTDPNCSPRGLYVPATATLEFGPKRSGQPRHVSLYLYDPRAMHSVQIRGRKLPLAADFQAPAHASLSVPSYKQDALFGLLRPGHYIKSRGLFLLEPYRSDKIPVVFIHGLRCDPQVWEAPVATLMADPKIGSRYQFWYYSYPTGLPVTSSAYALRKSIADLEATYDPSHTGVSAKHIVLVGHSMGGLLAQLQVIDSGNAFWRAYFTKPMGELRMSERMQQLANHLLYFNHSPAVEKVIFIATPHRGSDSADHSLGRLCASLISLPVHSLQTISQLLMLNTDAVNPKLWQFRHLGGTSIDSLSPKHPYFAAIASQPIQCAYYSIIGDRGHGDTPNSSDGVVPYSSSHVNGAASETIVPYGHGCAEEPLVTAEVRRILRDETKVRHSISTDSKHSPYKP